MENRKNRSVEEIMGRLRNLGSELSDMPVDSFLSPMGNRRIKCLKSAGIRTAGDVFREIDHGGSYMRGVDEILEAAEHYADSRLVTLSEETAVSAVRELREWISCKVDVRRTKSLFAKYEEGTARIIAIGWRNHEVLFSMDDCPPDAWLLIRHAMKELVAYGIPVFDSDTGKKTVKTFGFAAGEWLAKACWRMRVEM